MPDAFGVSKKAGDKVAHASEVTTGSGLVVAGLSANRFANYANNRVEGFIDRDADRQRAKVKVQPKRTPPGAGRAAKAKAKAQTKAYYTAHQKINAQRNRRIKLTRKVFNDVKIKGHKVPVGRGAMITAGFGAGVPLIWHGSREFVEKRVDKHDVDAGMAGALTSIGAYQAGLYSTKKIDRRIETNIANDPKLKAKATAHRKASGLPKNPPLGDTRWLKYHRTFPKDIPGWKWKRTMSYLHGGKSQVAVSGAVGALGAAAGVGLNRKIDPKKDRKP